MIAVDDIGAIAADAFARPGESIGTAVEIAGDEVSGPHIAEIFGDAYGMPGRSSRFRSTGFARSPGRKSR